jgi:hypothetical protein
MGDGAAAGTKNRLGGQDRSGAICRWAAGCGDWRFRVPPGVEWAPRRHTFVASPYQLPWLRPSLVAMKSTW